MISFQVRTNINFHQNNDKDCQDFSKAFKYQSTGVWASKQDIFQTLDFNP